MEWRIDDNFIIIVECDYCGHVDTIEPISTLTDYDNEKHPIYSSTLDFCSECEEMRDWQDTYVDDRRWEGDFY